MRQCKSGKNSALGWAKASRLREIARALLVGVVTLATMVGTTTFASAAPVLLASGNTSKLEVSMLVGGFDSKVAEANGYEIRTSESGTQYSVKKKGTLRGSSDDMTAQNQVAGSCGVSFLYINGRGGNAIDMKTGFAVRDAVSDFTWTVTLNDQGGQTKHDFLGHYDADGYVEKNRIVGGLTRGSANAYVIALANFAILVDGTVCFSGGPADVTTIF
jgi:hypothetical protein